MQEDIMQKDYSHLEGKKIKVLNVASGCGYGLVIGCDLDIGITIVDFEDHDLYLHCLIGPESPNFCHSQEARERHKRAFVFYVDWLEKGVDYDLGIDPLTGKPEKSAYLAGRPTALTCPFGQ
ncbi:MAG: hypothetical protein JRC93_13900 [Deltaproteobacteria bacterium]|nr:hypothetical protein [Deltaproteobacteria bacterium]